MHLAIQDSLQNFEGFLLLRYEPCHTSNGLLVIIHMNVSVQLGYCKHRGVDVLYQKSSLTYLLS